MPKAKPRSRKTRSELRDNNQQGVQPLHQQVLQRRARQSPPDVQPPVQPPVIEQQPAVQPFFVDIQQPVQPPVSQSLVHQPTSVNFQPPVIVQQPAVQPFLVDVQQPVQHQLLNVQPPMHQHGQPPHEQPQSVERRQLSDGTSNNISFSNDDNYNNIQQNVNLTTNSFDHNILVPLTVENVHFHVSTCTKNKIFNNEYIEMSALLPENQAEPSAKMLILLNGNIVTKEKQPKSITNVEKWSDAFIVFMSIYVLRHPEATQGLLKYMSVIRRLAARNANWVYYDSQFRLRKAVNPTSSWAVVDTELWLLSTSGNNQVFSDSRPCYDYNFKGLCQKQYCSYQHKCLKCTLNHPVCKCRFSDNNQASQNVSNFRPNRQNRMPVAAKAQQNTPRLMGPRFNTY